MITVSPGYNLKLNWVTGAPSTDTLCEPKRDLTEFLDWDENVSKRKEKY